MISVAICTFNRAESLRRTLESLVSTAPPQVAGWELLVIDNNSSDATRAVVAAFESTLPVRYVFEAEQGLSQARNRAIREFRGGLLLFTDDDVTVDRSWLVAYEAASLRFQVAWFFGGRIVPFWPKGRPRWLKDESLALISGVLVNFQLGDETREFGADDPLPFGASFALRRAAIDVIGEFRRDLGVNGGVPGRGEESDYLARVRAAGGRGVYVGTASVHHWTDYRRLTTRYLYGYGVQTGIAMRRTGSDASGSFFTAISYGVRGLLQLARGRGDRYRQCVINVGIQIALKGSIG